MSRHLPERDDSRASRSWDEGVGVEGGPVSDADTLIGGAADVTETGGDGSADPEGLARSIALRRLSGAPQTRHQLDEAMAKKGVPADVREHVLDRFVEVGLVDDAAFATAWVEARQASRGLSARALADELRRRGVEPDVIEDAIESIDPSDEECAARALVERKMRTMGTLDPATRSRRLIAMLGRKGYPAGLAYRIVRESVDEAPGEPFEYDDP